MISDWVAFSYTLSTKKKSSSRVAIWRRLQRLGAITPVAGVYVDNVTVVAGSAQDAQDALDKIKRAMDDMCIKYQRNLQGCFQLLQHMYSTGI